MIGGEMKSESEVYLNGAYVGRSDARLDIEDRGVLFADGVYEVLRSFQGRLFAAEEHLQRLRQSLAAIRIAEPPDVAAFPAISEQLIRRNQYPDAKIYWQVTRGPAIRSRGFPSDSKPTVLVLTWPDEPLSVGADVPCIRAVMVPDRRWHRCHIKSLMLLDNVLACQEAIDAGADEAIFERDGIVTEASSSNVFMVRGATLHTHPANNFILGGIGRAKLIELAGQMNVPIIEQPFDTDQLLGADELFICGTTTFVTAVTYVGDQQIGAGGPGPLTRRMHAALTHHIADACGLTD